MKRILVIDDDREFCKLLAELLVINDFAVDIVLDDFYKLTTDDRLKEYDLLIVDLYFEKFTGTQLIEVIREQNKECSIIIMTDSSDDGDEVKALQLGIDEYIRKNSSLSVILQRIRKVLESSESSNFDNNIFESTSERIRLDMNERVVTKNEVGVHLTQLEMNLLEYFLKNKNKLLSREDILSTVWKLEIENAIIDSRTVDVHIKNLRRKLDIASIHSIRGIGYRWHEK